MDGRLIITVGIFFLSGARWYKALQNTIVIYRRIMIGRLFRSHVHVGSDQSTCSVTGAAPSLEYETFNRSLSLGGKACAC